MSNHEEWAADTVVLDVTGKVTIGHDAQLRDAIGEASAAGAQNILLNMVGVSKLDSSGIGELVAAHTSIRRTGGRLLLVGLPEGVARVLQITNLLGVLELYENLGDALETLRGDG